MAVLPVGHNLTLSIDRLSSGAIRYSRTGGVRKRFVVTSHWKNQQGWASAGRGNQKDHYSTLGLPRDASKEQVKSTFRRLARKMHPDVNNNGSSSNQSFLAVLEAYDVLSDDAKRKAYDLTLPKFRQPLAQRSATTPPPTRRQGFDRAQTTQGHRRNPYPASQSRFSQGVQDSSWGSRPSSGSASSDNHRTSQESQASSSAGKDRFTASSSGKARAGPTSSGFRQPRDSATEERFRKYAAWAALKHPPQHEQQQTATTSRTARESRATTGSYPGFPQNHSGARRKSAARPYSPRQPPSPGKEPWARGRGAATTAGPTAEHRRGGGPVPFSTEPESEVQGNSDADSKGQRTRNGRDSPRFSFDSSPNDEDEAVWGPTSTWFRRSGRGGFGSYRSAAWQWPSLLLPQAASVWASALLHAAAPDLVKPPAGWRGREGGSWGRWNVWRGRRSGVLGVSVSPESGRAFEEAQATRRGCSVSRDSVDRVRHSARTHERSKRTTPTNSADYHGLHNSCCVNYGGQDACREVDLQRLGNSVFPIVLSFALVASICLAFPPAVALTALSVSLLASHAPLGFRGACLAALFIGGVPGLVLASVLTVMARFPAGGYVHEQIFLLTVALVAGPVMWKGLNVSPFAAAAITLQSALL